MTKVMINNHSIFYLERAMNFMPNSLQEYLFKYRGHIQYMEHSASNILLE